MIKETEISEFRKNFDYLLKLSNKILITSHKSPDDDSISSVLSLYQYLSENYSEKKIKMRYSGIRVTRWSFFKDFDKIEFVEDISGDINSFDLLICVDGSSFTRFSNTADKIEDAKIKKICIDHHSGLVDRFDLILSDNKAASCAELIYLLFYKDLPSIDVKTRECLLLGIIGDTGSFTFITPEQAYVFGIAQRLIAEGGIDIQTMKSKYLPYSENAFTALKEFYNNAKIYAVESWPKIYTAFITEEFLLTNNLDLKDADVAAHQMLFYSLNVENVSWSAVVYPKSSGETSISFRSLPESINVRLVATEFGNGGGHDRAAGVKIKDVDLKEFELLNNFLNWLKTHKPIF